MSNFWVERLEQHPIHQSLLALKAALADARQRETDEGVEVALSRLDLVTEYARRAVSSIDPFLASVATLDQLVTSIAAMTASVHAYVSEGHPDQLTAANMSGDALIPHLHALLVPAVPDDAVDLGKAIAALRKTVDQRLAETSAASAQHLAALAELQGKIDAAKVEVQAQVDATKADVTAQKTRLDTALTEFQSHSSTQETARQAAFAESESRRQTIATEADQKRAEQFSAVEEQRRTQQAVTAEERTKAFDAIKAEWTEATTKWRAQYDEDQKGRKEAFDAFLKGANEGAAAWDRSAADVARVRIEALDAKKAEAEKLVGVIANTGMTGGYQRVANIEMWAARVWQGFALLAMVGLIAFAIYAAVHTTDPDFKWPLFAGRAIVAAACGILATYAARQSKRHLDVERRSRKIELELASIDPYLASLPDDKRIEVKRLLAERFFGQALPIDADDEKTAGTVADLGKGAIQTLGNVATELAKRR
jgi:hypothetical protein